MSTRKAAVLCWMALTAAAAVVWAQGTRIEPGGLIVQGNLSAAGTLTNFTANSVRLTNTTPIFTLAESDAAANNKYWDLISSGTSFYVRAVSDDYATATNLLSATRSGSTVDTVTLSGSSVANTGRYLSAVTQPGFFASNSGSDTCIAPGPCTVDFDTESYDDGGNFAADTFTAPVTGKYLLCAQITTSSATAGATTTMVFSGVTGAPTSIVPRTTSGVDVPQNQCVVASLSASAAVTVTAQNSAGENLTIRGDLVNVRTYFSGRLMP